MKEDPKRDALLETSRAPGFRQVARVAPERSPETPTAKAPDPELGHAIIRKERYISEEFMRLEWERMWTHVWLLGASRRTSRNQAITSARRDRSRGGAARAPGGSRRARLL